jgi:hypothetical protein
LRADPSTGPTAFLSGRHVCAVGAVKRSNGGSSELSVVRAAVPAEVPRIADRITETGQRHLAAQLLEIRLLS